MNVEKIREDFPVLKRKVNDKPLIYLDNAASTQKPQVVIDAVKDFYENHYSNVHRGIHTLSEEATEQYEKIREKIHNFAGADENYQTIFTHGTTESINLISYAWGLQNLKAGDEIIISVMEHHSNVVPWHYFLDKGVKVNYIDMDENYELKLDHLQELINKNTKIVSLIHVSNVLGTINNVKEAGKIAKDNGSLFIVDGAQASPSIQVNIKDIQPDFYSFSGHKMLGPTGIGALMGRKELLEEMNPFMYGGNMINEVNKDGTTFAELPAKFEPGTPNIAGTIGFGAAIDYLNKIGMDNILDHERNLLKHALERLSEVPNLTVYGPEVNKKIGIVSFTYSDIHPHDVATIVDNNGVAIRSGHHCAQILMKRLNIPATSRASLYLYNTKEEIDTFVNSLMEARKVFGV